MIIIAVLNRVNTAAFTLIESPRVVTAGTCCSSSVPEIKMGQTHNRWIATLTVLWW